MQASNEPGTWGCPWFRKLSRQDGVVGKSRLPDLESTFSSLNLCYTRKLLAEPILQHQPLTRRGSEAEAGSLRTHAGHYSERPPGPPLAPAHLLLGARGYGFGPMEGEMVLVELS